MSKCPEGHTLPHKFNGVRCTPLACGQLSKGRAISQAGAVNNLKIRDEKEELKFIERNAKKDAAFAQTRLTVRNSMVEQPPEGLDTAEAEEWTQKKMVALLPAAVAELEYQLKFGDDRQRMDAARDVLDANGMRKRDAITASGQTIVLNIANLPWSPVVNGEVKNGIAQKQPREDARSGQGALPKNRTE